MQSKYICLTILLLIISNVIFSQSRWMRIYHDEIDAPMRYILESYDKGYLLSGKTGANYSKYNWIIKTDVNGEILWEKTIGDGITGIVLPQMAMNNAGDLYICGESRNEDPSGDPIIMKLNACGEKEWCKILYSPDHHDFAECICVTPDEGCAVTLNVTGQELWEDRICLAKFSADGIIEWKQCYNSQDSLLGNEDDANLILTPDKGFLISGWCYYTDPTGTLAWLHPYYIKTDSLGNFMWDLISEKETGESGGQAWQTIISPDGQYYYSSISHYYSNPQSSSPALVKFDLEGNIIGIYDLNNGNDDGKIFTSVFTSDTLIACGAGWGNLDEDFVSMALIVDTLGNIVDSKLLLNDIYLSHVRKTFDDKLLFYTQSHLSGQFDVYLFKLNQALEDDTIYTNPFVYDTLCPYQILSDTIGYDDCELIVGIEEPGGGEAGKQGGREAWDHGGLNLWPNPAKTIVNCQLSAVDFQFNSTFSIDNLALVIYDIFGREIHAEMISSTREGGGRKGGWTIDISSLSPGIYIVFCKDKENRIYSGKFIKSLK
jgi:hypothetical protein